MDASASNVYQVNKHAQLIPLNGAVVNFKCFFEVQSKHNKPFNLAIVEDTNLTPKQYKAVDDGKINGTVESDGRIKSYFLVLKSVEPCDCQVRVVLHPVIEHQNPAAKAASSTAPVVVDSSPPEASDFKSYIVGGLVVAGAILVALAYKKNFFPKKGSLMPSDSSSYF
jgi:hypothetical protein